MNQPYGYSPHGSPPQGYPPQGYRGGPPPGYPAPPGPPGGPQGYPPQGVGMPQPGPPPQGMGRVVLETSYMPLAFMLALFKPVITIDGRPGPVGVWGRSVIDLPPGQHQIQIHVNYVWQFGQAVAVVPVGPGQQIGAFYRAPAVAFGNGAIGPMPQQTPNLPLAIVLMVVPVLIVLLLVLLVAI